MYTRRCFLQRRRVQSGQFEVPPIGERVDRVAEEAVDGAADHSAAPPAVVPVAQRLLDARRQPTHALLHYIY